MSLPSHGRKAGFKSSIRIRKDGGGIATAVPLNRHDFDGIARHRAALHERTGQPTPRR